MKKQPAPARGRNSDYNHKYGKSVLDEVVKQNYHFSAVRNEDGSIESRTCKNGKIIPIERIY